MNIKSEDAYKLARELAAETGESLTKAVTIAVRERLERLRGSHQPTMSDKLVAIAKDCGPRLVGLPDHGDFLYGEDGLPK
jgi:antitoxin VapB